MISKIIFVMPAGIVVLLLNAFWILPVIFTKRSPIGQLGNAYLSADAVNFLSFNKFEYALSLLHPNWPQNIFGKVDFLRSEFLIFPILAYGSLLFVKGEKKIIRLRVFFLVICALLGTFLAKGTNEPFGSVYIWLFQHFPGFIMFRDATKWYLLVVIAYTLLIPFTLEKVAESKILIKNLGKYSFLITISLFLIYLVTILRPAYIGELTGTFKPMNIPKEYSKLATFEDSQKDFYRTLWIPSRQEYSFNDYNHPVISGYDYFKVYDPISVAKMLQKTGVQQELQRSSVKYVIIPDDTLQNIFVTDRKYDPQVYEKTLSEVRNVPYLHEISGFTKLHVFELTGVKNHFWILGGGDVAVQEINPSEYSLTAIKAGTTIIFNDSYDPGWTAMTSQGKVSSTPYTNRYNSFTFPNSIKTASIIYTPQVWADRGIFVMLFTICMLVVITFVKIFYNLVVNKMKWR